MAWDGIDGTAYADDDSLGAFIPVRMRSNLRDSVTNRTQSCSHSYGRQDNHTPVFSAPTDEYLALPFLFPANDGYDTLNCRIRFELDSAGTSGIIAGADGMDLQLAVEGYVGDVVTIDVTGSGGSVAEADLTCDVGVLPERAIKGEIRFKCKQGSTPGNVTIKDVRRRNILHVDEDSAFLGTGKTHYEIATTDLDSGTQTFYVPHVEASSAASHSHALWVWPHLDGAGDWPFGDGGQTAAGTVYNLPAITLYGWELRWDGDPDALRRHTVPDVRSMGAGQHCRSSTFSLLSSLTRHLYEKRRKVWTCGPLSAGHGASNNDYVCGVRAVGAASGWIRVAGAIFDRPADSTGVWSYVMHEALHGTGSQSVRIRVTLEELGGSSATETVTSRTSGAAPMTFPGEPRTTLLRYNVDGIDHSVWGMADLGYPGDYSRTTVDRVRIEYPSGVAVGDTCRVYVEVQDIDLFVPAACIVDVGGI